MNKTIIVVIIIGVIGIILFLLMRYVVVIDGVVGLKQIKNSNTPKENKFTYNFQFSDYNNNQVDDKGDTDYTNIINEFNNFNWKKEISNPDLKTSPTIGIQDHLTGYELGISGIGIDNDNNIYFHLFFVINNDVKILQNQNAESVKDKINLFFNRDYTKLKEIFII